MNSSSVNARSVVVRTFPAPNYFVTRMPRWAPLFEVVFKGSQLEAFFREDGHSSEEYLDKLLSLRPLYAPAFLDMASMGKMVGGSFLAGIEVGREASDHLRLMPDIRHQSDAAFGQSGCRIILLAPIKV